MKNILVTGGAGFIGSNIIDHIISQNQSNVNVNGNKNIIRVLDNLSTGNKSNIQKFIDTNQIEFVYGDISCLDTCRKCMKDIHVVCHQAALGSVPRSLDDPLLSHVSNVNGFLNILISAKENNVKRVVYASSSAVYGDDEHLPKVEDSVGDVLSPYGATKKIDEIYANIFTRCYGMECIGLRYFNVFGPRQSPDGPYAAVIPKFIDLMTHNDGLNFPTINGDGKNSRDFTHVHNVIQANILALTTENSQCYGNVFNIGAGGNVTLNELYEILKRELGYGGDVIYAPARGGDILHSHADISKARKLLGYDPKIGFALGIKKLIHNC